MSLQDLLAEISEQYNQILAKNLVGIYVHGSIAFGCFNWQKSDIDFLVVVKTPLSQDVKLQLFYVLENLRNQAPPKGFEMSVVLHDYCKNFVHPTPYEAHYSRGLHMKGDSHNEDLAASTLEYSSEYKTDADLAAHFTIITNIGIVLRGEPIENVFEVVPKKDYLDSIRNDIINAKEDVVRDPVYIILNLCRVYAYIKDELILSKEQGGRWGLANLPKQYHSLIESMVNNYVSGELFIKDETLQVDFCRYMLDLIF